MGADITVHANGLVLACEDAADELARGTRLLALGGGGRAEWAGATFSPDGSTLFVNIYTPGMTFAITGPWQALAAGALAET